VAARTAVSTAAWRTNEAVRVPRLDAEYFIGWARDIWSGDVLGLAASCTASRSCSIRSTRI
jgi:hypothetical protein